MEEPGARKNPVLAFVISTGMAGFSWSSYLGLRKKAVGSSSLVEEAGEGARTGTLHNKKVTGFARL
jgi:hypothetical protein